MSDADLALNKKLKQEEIEDLHLAGGESSDAEAMGGFESLREEDKKMILEMLAYARKRAQVNEGEDNKKKKKKVKKSEEQAEQTEPNEEE